MKPDSAQPSQNKIMSWGSDVVAEMLRRFDLLAALERGSQAVERGEPYLVDVLIEPARGAAFDWQLGA